MRLTKKEAVEYARCAKSVTYTIKNYGHLKHIKLGKIRWQPYEWQIELLEHLQDGRNVVILKSRQVGASWTIAGYVAWLIHFRPDIECLLLSSKQDAAIKLLGKVRFICNNFPDFIRREFNSNSKTRLSVIHKREGADIVSESSVDSLTTTGESGRGDTAAFVFCDELAHLVNAEETWTAIKPTTSRGGQIVAASSPAGPEGTFARIWMEADTGESATFIPMRVHYTDCGLDHEWLAEASDGMTEQQIMQEFELAFIGIGSPAFDPGHLESCYIPMSQIMSDPELEDIKQKVLSSRLYTTGIDTAEIKSGRGKRRRDYNAVCSMNEYGIQIKAEANQMLLDEWAGKTMDIGNMRVEVPGYVSKWHIDYPGLMFIEENGPGLTVENRHMLPDNPKSEVAVRRTSSVRKQRMVDQFRLALAGQQILITDKATYYQLTLFQDMGGGKYEAPTGYKDDLVIAILLAYDALIEQGGYDFVMPQVKKQELSEIFYDASGVVHAPDIPEPGLENMFDGPEFDHEDWEEFLPSGGKIDALREIAV